MPNASTCPDVQQLKRLMLGQLPAATVEPLAQHLEACPACLRTVQTLQAEDTLAEALRRQATPLGDGDNEAVARLVARLAQLPPLRPEATAGLPAAAPPPPGPPLEATHDSHDFLAPAEAPGEIGRLGGYRVLNVLGQGGMGVVFQAEDVNLQRLVALKVMRPAIAANPAAKGRFLREARACAALRHDHIITIHQVGEDRGVPFIAVEFLEGMPLDQYLDRGRKPTVPQILRIGREVAKGLAAAHDKGLIHRDIKPGNIWLDKQSGRVKILDFGLARTQGEDVNITQSGAIVGTPAYMAPEQARAEKVDARCDLFSLGCVLFKLCTGQVPFKGDTTMAVLTSLALDTPPPVHELNPAIPAALSDLVAKLLAKKPEDRPASAKDVIKAIQTIESGLSVRSAVTAPAAAPVAPVVAPAANPFADLTEAGPALVVPPRTAPASGGRKAPVELPRKRKPPAGQRGADTPRSPDRRKLLIGAAALAAVVVLAGVVIIIKNRDGTENRVEVAGNQDVKVENGVVTITPKPTTPQPPPVRPAPPPPAGASPFDQLKREDIPADAVNLDAIKDLPELVAVLGKPQGKTGFSLLQVTPDGRQVISAVKGPKQTSLIVWDPVTGDRLREQTLPEVGYDDPSPTQDGQRLLLGSSSLTIFDLTTGQNVQTIPMPEPVQRTGFVYKRIISPDGRRIAATHSVDKQSTLLILDASDGKVLFSREGLDGSPRLFFSPDGKRLALSRNANDGFSASTWMLDADTGKELFTLEGCQVLDFSPDSQRVAATNRAGGFTIHSASARVSLIKSSEPGKPALIDQARFSPDGKWLAAMYSQRLTLFDAESGKQLRQLTLPTGLSNFAFAPDGRHLLAGSGVDGTIYVLRLAPPPPAE